MPIKNLNNKGFAPVAILVSVLVLSVFSYFGYSYFGYSYDSNQNVQEDDVLQATAGPVKKFNTNLIDAYLREVGLPPYSFWNKEKTAAIIGLGRNYHDNFYEDNTSDNVTYKEIRGCYFYTRASQAYKGNLNGKGYTAYTNVQFLPGFWAGEKINLLVAVIPNTNVTDLDVKDGKNIVNDCGSRMLLFRGPESLPNTQINNYLISKTNLGTSAIIDVVSKGRRGNEEVLEVSVNGNRKDTGVIYDIIRNEGVVRLDGPNFKQSKYTIFKPAIKQSDNSFSFTVVALPNTLTFYVNSPSTQIDAKMGKVPAGWKVNFKQDGLDRIKR